MAISVKPHTLESTPSEVYNWGKILYNLLFGEALPPTWFILSVVAAAILDIVAAVALWRWKKWGLTLYLIATSIVIVLGILATGAAMLWSFSRLLPFIIVGYIVKPHFGQP